jgi:hypothetical protein
MFRAARQQALDCVGTLFVCDFRGARSAERSLLVRLEDTAMQCHRPEVGHLRRFAPSIAAIEIGVLAQQIPPVRGVQPLVTQPRRQNQIVAHDRQAHAVAVAPPHPLLDHRVHVEAQRVLVAPPHQHSGVVAPGSRLGIGEHIENLKGFEALFAKSPRIERLRAAAEVGVGKKGLHGALHTTMNNVTYIVQSLASRQLLPSLDAAGHRVTSMPSRLAHRHSRNAVTRHCILGHQ